MAPSSSRNGATVRLVAIHTAEGARTKESLGNYFNSGVAASSHVGIDAGGSQLYVDYSRAAWTLRSGNPISDNAELCAFARWNRAQWLGTATVDGCANPLQILKNAAAWTRARCEARGIPKVKLSPADVRAGKSGVIGHIDWTLGMSDGSHTDPGPNFPWDVFMELVNGGDAAPTSSLEYDNVFGGTWDASLEAANKVIVIPTKSQAAVVNRAWLSVATCFDGTVYYDIYFKQNEHTLLEEVNRRVEANNRKWWKLPDNTTHVTFRYSCAQPVGWSVETEPQPAP